MPDSAKKISDAIARESRWELVYDSRISEDPFKVLTVRRFELDAICRRARALVKLKKRRKL